MTSDTTKKIVSINAAIWASATLASVILPFVTDSLTQGRSAFLRIVAHAAPLFVGMYISSISLARATQKPTS
jgi:hypothetical protein